MDISIKITIKIKGSNFIGLLAAIYEISQYFN